VNGWGRTRKDSPDLHLRHPATVVFLEWRDGGVRVRRQLPADVGNSFGILALRSQGAPKIRILELRYRRNPATPSTGILFIADNRIDLLPPNPTEQQRGESRQRLIEKEIPALSGEFTAEFIAIGNRLHGRVNGETISFTLLDGPEIGWVDVSEAHMLPFRDVEVIHLDGLSEAEALKAAGIKE
jgi:hypothetical protein